jgi:hypothetical protein
MNASISCLLLSPGYRAQLGEALSAVNALSTLISSCAPATAINVHWSEFVQTGTTKDITDTLVLASKNWNCSTFELEHQTAEAIQGLRDIFSKPYCEINWNYFNKIRLMVHHDPGTVIDFLLDLVSSACS